MHGTLTSVREGLATGRTELLGQFIDAVHEQTALEHRQWIEDSQALYPAFKTLQEGVAATS